MYKALEAFMDYCDDMIIANEGMTKDKFELMKRKGQIKPVDEIVDYKVYPSNDIVDILKKFGCRDDIRKKHLTHIANKTVPNMYREEYSNISTSDIHKLCSEIRPYQNEIVEISLDTHDQKYKSMFNSLKLVFIASIGNGDSYLYSLSNKKMYEYVHDSKEAIRPSMNNSKHQSFDEWKKVDTTNNANESFFDLIVNEASFRRGFNQITMTLGGEVKESKNIEKNEEYTVLVKELKDFVKKIDKTKVFNEIKKQVLSKNKSWAKSVGLEKPLTDKQIEDGILFKSAHISAYSTDSVTLWVKVKNWGKMNDGITDVECFLKKDGTIDYMNIHNG